MNVVEWFLSLSENLVVTSDYGWRSDPFTGEQKFHQGVDIAGESEGFPTPAPSKGEVILATYSDSYGYYFNFQQEGASYYLRVAHLYNLNVTTGMEVLTGFNLGGMGTSGSSTGVHWHIEVWKDGSHVDPNTVQMYDPESTGSPVEVDMDAWRIMMSRRIQHRRR